MLKDVCVISLSECIMKPDISPSPLAYQQQLPFLGKPHVCPQSRTIVKCHHKSSTSFNFRETCEKRSLVALKASVKL